MRANVSSYSKNESYNHIVHGLALFVEKYFAFYEIVENEDSSTGYTIDHSLTTYLIGRDGQVVELLKRDWTSSELAQAIRAALRK